jgi:hypothetical protein
MTTADAFMKMVKPPAGSGASNFVRVYTPNLKDVTYSSLITSFPTFSNSVEIYGVLPEKDGVLAVGTSGAIGLIPQKAPTGMTWSFPPTSSPTNPNGFFGRLVFDSTNFSVAQDTIQYPVIPVVTSAEVLKTNHIEPNIYPNPGSGKVYVHNIEFQDLSLVNLHGKVLEKTTNSFVDLSNHANGIYLLRISTSKGILVRKIEKK